MVRSIVFIMCVALFLPAETNSADKIPDIESQVTRSKRKRDDKDGDFDDKAQSIVITLKAKNNEYDPVKGLVWKIQIVGEIMTDELMEARDEAYIVLDEQEIRFDIDREAEIETNAITVAFDESDAGRRGARFQGYISTLYDSQSRIISRESDERILNKDLERAADLPVMKPFDKRLDLKPKIKHSVSVKKPN